MYRTQNYVILASLLIGVAYGDQPQPASTTLPGGLEVFLDNQSVQRELKLSDEQVQRIKELKKRVRQNQAKAVAKVQEANASAEERKTKLKDAASSAAEEMRKGTNDILGPEQLKRLKQIRLQAECLEALLEPEVTKALKLTDDQISKIHTIQRDLQTDSRALLRAGPQNNFQGSLRKMMALRRDSLDKGIALLTPEQIQIWKELAGDPFEIRVDRFIVRPSPADTDKREERDKR
jgi:hypothetical protein